MEVNVDEAGRWACTPIDTGIVQCHLSTTWFSMT